MDAVKEQFSQKSALQKASISIAFIVGIILMIVAGLRKWNIADGLKPIIEKIGTNGFVALLGGVMLIIGGLEFA